MKDLERRFLPFESREIRMDSNSENENFVSGYGAVYYREGDPSTQFDLIPGYLIERFAPGCFDQAISEDDIRCLFNHHPNLILGRNKAQTLEVSSDDVGLNYRCKLPETTVGKDLAISLGRRDVTGSSIGMIVHAEEITHGEKERPTIRLITRAGLYDVSPVTYPAYEGTTASNRSADTVLEEIHKNFACESRSKSRRRKIRQLRKRIADQIAK